MAKLKVAWRRATERANAARARRSMLQTRAELRAAAQKRAEEEAEQRREAGRMLEETIARRGRTVENTSLQIAYGFIAPLMGRTLAPP